MRDELQVQKRAGSAADDDPGGFSRAGNLRRVRCRRGGKSAHRDKPGIVAYIERNFKVSTANAAESYEDINGVMLDSLMMREDQIQKYLEGAHARGEIPRPVSAGDMCDFSLLRNLK